jgi:hypothetical protein
MIDCGATYFSSQSSNTTPWFFFMAEIREFGGRMGTVTTLVKNFCAWLRICTAVLVAMCSTRTQADDGMRTDFFIDQPNQFARHQEKRPSRTLYASPGTAV